MDLTHLPRMEYQCDTKRLYVLLGATIKLNEEDYNELHANKMVIGSNTSISAALAEHAISFVTPVLIMPFDKPTEAQQKCMDKLVQGISLARMEESILQAPECERISSIYRQGDGWGETEERWDWKNNEQFAF